MLNRRELLQRLSCGFGLLALRDMASAATSGANPLAPKVPMFPARAKRVIFLCMHGAPSHVDTFDYKPRLLADTGRPSPISRLAGARLLGSPWSFSQHGQSGQ